MKAVLNNETVALAEKPEQVLDAVDQHMPAASKT